MENELREWVELYRLTQGCQIADSTHPEAFWLLAFPHRNILLFLLSISSSKTRDLLRIQFLAKQKKKGQNEGGTTNGCKRITSSKKKLCGKRASCLHFSLLTGDPHSVDS
jgi:hypothetical protein